MSPLILWLTVALIAIPVTFILYPLVFQGPSFLTFPGILLGALYAVVWVFWRPTRFELSPNGSLDIVFPGRRREIAASELVGCRWITQEQFRQEFGHALRVGVGGLWGGFGFLWTSKGGSVDFYVSRTDGFVLIERRSSRPILITPEDPRGMVGVMERLLS
jgi:hypothetical protein